MKEILLAPVLLAIIWYWWETMQCKEMARIAGRQSCRNADVQFLDDTVEQKKLWLRRAENGRLQLCRIFFFEFSSDGAQRYQGRIIMLGKTIKEVEMDAYRI
jgi:hypothetical protein